MGEALERLVVVEGIDLLPEGLRRLLVREAERILDELLDGRLREREGYRSRGARSSAASSSAIISTESSPSGSGVRPAPGYRGR